MKRFAFFALAALWLPLSAFAEPMDLTVGQADDLMGALAVLSNGHDHIVKEGTTERVVTEHFHGFQLGTLMAMAKDINALRGAVEAYEHSRHDRSLELSDDSGKLPPKAQLALDKEDAKARAVVLHFDLEKFYISELKPADNDLASAVLANLAPLVKPEK